MADIFLTNSLTRKKEKFTPISPSVVSLYTCGMTVYDFAHIGHGRKYVGDDILRRVLTFNGYKVNHVQNVTDVGHLVSDADEGEDKLEKGARKLGKTVWQVAEFFTKHFYSSMDKLNVLRPQTIAKATEHIDEQIALIMHLVDKKYAYDTPEAVYFDINKFSNYGKLFGQKLGEKRVGARKEVQTGQHKKNPADFSLWFKTIGKYKNHVMHWASPWGDGFPGWHIECSAMSMKYLGEQIDIHTGGEDHLPIHHPNEIAQSEAATGKKPFVRYWIHHAFLKVNGRKMSKSLENLFTLEDVEKRGFDPFALRYLYLTAHYKDSLNFTWQGLTSAQNALNKLRDRMVDIKAQTGRTTLSGDKNKKVDSLRSDFIKAVNDDLNTPQALALVWEVLKSSIPSSDKYDLLLYFDEVLGLGLAQIPSRLDRDKIPNEIKRMMEKREEMRKKGKFKEADKIRAEIGAKGFILEDTPKGARIKGR